MVKILAALGGDLDFRCQHPHDIPTLSRVPRFGILYPHFASLSTRQTQGADIYVGKTVLHVK